MNNLGLVLVTCVVCLIASCNRDSHKQSHGVFDIVQVEHHHGWETIAVIRVYSDGSYYWRQMDERVFTVGNYLWKEIDAEEKKNGYIVRGQLDAEGIKMLRESSFSESPWRNDKGKLPLCEYGVLDTKTKYPVIVNEVLRRGQVKVARSTKSTRANIRSNLWIKNKGDSPGAPP
jgi:hypothetical protein